MRKNIVLCFDGTGCSVQGHDTNVMRLFRSLERSDRQLVYYDPGVGTLADPAAKGWWSRFVTRSLDGAIGYSLRENFCEAYRFLVRVYEPGDDLFLFGFSRGAYTARAVAAGLHHCGLVPSEHENMIPYVWSLLLNEPGLNRDRFFQMSARFKGIFSTREVMIHFLGVWDTVSTVGWLWDLRSIPYTRKNKSVRHIRHAVSIDERRAFFRSNLFRFTGKSVPPRGATWREFFRKLFRFCSPRDGTLEDPVRGQDLKEVWFPGFHSDVGGGHEDQKEGLAKVALQWMLREAETERQVPSEGSSARSVQLHVDQHEKERCLGGENRPDPLATPNNSLTWWWWPCEFVPRRSWDSETDKKRWKWPNLFRRRAIAPGSTVHRSVVDRLEHPSLKYKPKRLPPLAQLNIED